MLWLDKDKYHMICGEYTIAIYFNGYNKRYGLSKQNKNLGYFDNLDDAKQCAKNLLTNV